MFWARVRDKVVPARAATAQPGAGIPAALVHQLLTQGVPESEVAGMTRADALRRLNELRSGEWLSTVQPADRTPVADVPLVS